MEKAGRQILIYDSAAGVARAGAELLVARAREKGKGLKIRVALSGGSTPNAMYDILRMKSGDDARMLKKVRYFFGDERAVANNHPESNVRLAVDGFLKPLGIPDTQIYPPNGAAQVLTAEAWRLTLVLERTLPKFEETNLPEFDLIYLGMGPDGHTASLFPNTEGLEAEDPGFIMNEVPQLKTRRLTLTFPVLNVARELAIMVTGENKAKVLEEIFTRGEGDKLVYPIEQLAARKMTWYLDKAAAARIPREVPTRRMGA
ncbi:6-phosphogluconolactonase [soil metagenome]